MGFLRRALQLRHDVRYGAEAADARLAGDMVFGGARDGRGPVGDVERHAPSGPPPVEGAQWDEVHRRWEVWSEPLARWVVVGDPGDGVDPADEDPAAAPMVRARREIQDALDALDASEAAEAGDVDDAEGPTAHAVRGEPPVRGAQWNESTGQWERWDDRWNRWVRVEG